MHHTIRFLRLAALVAIAMLSVAEPLGAEEHERVLFAFDTPTAAGAWQTVNDGVMGGQSDGRFQITELKTMEFFGTLSLENNGGFASVRSRPKQLNLKEGDLLTARIRGDGREYFWNLYVPGQQVAFSYRAPFRVEPGQWIEVCIPLKDFYATSFGRRVPNAPLEPGQVNSLGFLLADKKPGPFKLEIDWIKVTNDGSREAAANDVGGQNRPPPATEPGPPALETTGRNTESGTPPLAPIPFN